MRNQIAGFFAFMVLFVAGCASAPTIQVLDPYEPTLTAENAATFIFPKEIMVQKMDDAAASSFEGRVPGWVSASSTPVSILIPSGEHTFVCVFVSQIDGNVMSAEDLSVGAHFEAGKTYLLAYQISGNTVTLTINEQIIVK
jgi:hypothetical protein